MNLNRRDCYCNCVMSVLFTKYMFDTKNGLVYKYVNRSYKYVNIKTATYLLLNLYIFYLFY